MLILAAPMVSAAETFQTYANPRFNYSIDYPPKLLLPKGEAPNGDGQIFASADLQAQMIIYGTHNVLEQTIQDLFKKESQDASSQQITKKVTYMSRPVRLYTFFLNNPGHRSCQSCRA